MTTPKTASFPLRRVDVHRQEGEDGIVLAGEQGDHVVNETALALWELCDGSTDPEEMVDAICVLFGEPHELVASDVRRALDDFTRDELIEWVERSP